MPKLTLRELFALVTIVALALGWWLDRSRLASENKSLRVSVQWLSPVRKKLAHRPDGTLAWEIWEQRDWEGRLHPVKTIYYYRSGQKSRVSVGYGVDAENEYRSPDGKMLSNQRDWMEHFGWIDSVVVTEL